MVAQAMSGTMSITGQPDGPPTRAGVPIADMYGSLMGVTGILAALVARNETGRGQHVDISMLDAQISTLNYAATSYFRSNENPTRIGNAHINHVPYDVYPCQDGHIIMAVVTDGFWRKLMNILELPEIDTEENQMREGRLNNRDQINRELGRIFITRSKDFWLEKMRAAGIPSGPVNDFTETFAEPQVKARNMVIEVDYPQGERVRMPGNPIKLSDTDADTFTPSPALGEHNHKIFGDLLGKSGVEIGELERTGVI
jgi:crotonobetainyl-CoA:carnitine CoA-transferase CaiB-like acyl-CoA transferase